MLIAHWGVMAGPSRRHGTSRLLHTASVLLARPASSSFPLPTPDYKPPVLKRPQGAKAGSSEIRSKFSPQPQSQTTSPQLPSHQSALHHPPRSKFAPTTPARGASPPRSSPPRPAASSHGPAVASEQRPVKPQQPAPQTSRQAPSKTAIPHPREPLTPSATPSPSADAPEHTLAIPKERELSAGLFDAASSPTLDPPAPACAPSTASYPAQTMATTATSEPSAKTAPAAVQAEAKAAAAEKPARDTARPQATTPIARPGLDLLAKIRQTEVVPPYRWPWHAVPSDKPGVEIEERIIFARPNLHASWKAQFVLAIGSVALFTLVFFTATVSVKPWLLDDVLPDISTAWEQGRYWAIPSAVYNNVEFLGMLSFLIATLIPAFGYQVYCQFSSLVTRISLLRKTSTAQTGVKTVEHVLRLRTSQVYTPYGVDRDIPVTAGTSKNWGIERLDYDSALLEITYPTVKGYFRRKVEPTKRILDFRRDDNLTASNELYVFSEERLTRIFGPIASEAVSPDLPVLLFIRATWSPLFKFIGALRLLIPPPIRRRILAWWNAP